VVVIAARVLFARLRQRVGLQAARTPSRKAKEVLVAAALVLLVAGPWLAPGYLFGTDWPGARRYTFPTSLSNSAPLLFMLALASKVFSAEIAAKLFLLGFLFLAAWLAYRAVPVGGAIPRLAAAVLYVCNPFVYGRLHYGQFFAIAAYAVLPWIAERCRLLVINPSVRSAVLLALGLATEGALDLHIFIVASTLVAVLVLAGILLHHAKLIKLAPAAALAGALTLALCSYWLIPFAAGRSGEARAITQIGSSDLTAYQVVPDTQFGLLPNLLGLYGFWAEDVNRFPSFKLFVPYWQVVLAAFLLLALVGVIAVAFASATDLPGGLRWWIAGLIVAGAIGLVLEIGVADPRVGPLIHWLDAVFPPYRGMRDSGKWASILALVYAQLIPLGIIGLLDAVKGRFKSRTFGEWTTTVVAGLALALPLYYGNGLLFGMHGEIRPSMYPAGWYAADGVIAADPKHGRALFLPWHQYLRLSFVRNVDSVVATPAPSFFSIPMVVSADPEVAGIAPPNDPEQRVLARLAATGASADWATALRARNIKYVLLAKEVDWSLFAFLDHQPGFSRVGDYGSIMLYRVSAIP
jgi:hypothetical protein